MRCKLTNLVLLNFALLQANKSGLDGEGAVITLLAGDDRYLNDDIVPSASLAANDVFGATTQSLTKAAGICCSCTSMYQHAVHKLG